MKRFVGFISSVHLAVAVILFISLFGALSTLIPQGATDAAYRAAYPGILGELIVAGGMGHFFRSPLFLIPVLVFFANLGACTLRRFLRELRKKGKRRHGPDILHVGLLVLVLGSLASFAFRKEGAAYLRPGESVELPGGELLTLRDFRFDRYEDGRPKDWVSTVDLSSDGKIVKRNIEIRVNAPLRTGGLSIYQASWTSEPKLLVRGSDGAEGGVGVGETFRDGPFSAFFMTTETTTDGQGTVALVRVVDGSGGETVRVGDGMLQRAGYSLSLGQGFVTGLQAVSDPAYIVVVIALALIAAGVALSFGQKLHDLEVSRK